MPEIWDKKFNATLSAINIELALPIITAITEFFWTEDPSFFFNINLIFLSTCLNDCFANNKPATIAFWLETIFASIILLFFNNKFK